MAMLRRLFGTERIERAPGHFDRTHFLKCGHPGCATIEYVYFRAGLGTPAEAVYKKFQQKNWHVDLNDAAKDRCPHHKTGRAAIHIVPKSRAIDAANAVFQTPQPFARLSPPTPAQPKEPPAMSLNAVASAPSLQDRRLIFAKLNEVYLDEKQGYKAPWTDAAVAKDLGIIEQWVAELRKENFGPLGINGELHELAARARQLADEAGKALEELQHLAPQIHKALALKESVDKLLRRLDEMKVPR